MDRKNFKTIIKSRSYWTIDRRKGNYKLPNGERLFNYVLDLVDSQADLDNLGIAKNGNLYDWDKTNKCLLIPYGDNEPTTEEQQENRRTSLTFEIIGI